LPTVGPVSHWTQPSPHWTSAVQGAQVLPAVQYSFEAQSPLITHSTQLWETGSQTPVPQWPVLRHSTQVFAVQ